jgi:hypothetical protein
MERLVCYRLGELDMLDPQQDSQWISEDAMQGICRASGTIASMGGPVREDAAARCPFPTTAPHPTSSGGERGSICALTDEDATYQNDISKKLHGEFLRETSVLSFYTLP